jgi:hypothetical protein
VPAIADRQLTTVRVRHVGSDDAANTTNADMPDRNRSEPAGTSSVTASRHSTRSTSTGSPPNAPPAAPLSRRPAPGTSNAPPMTSAARTERRQASSSSPAPPCPSTRDRVFDPLRMSRTDFLRTDPLASDVATGHRGRQGRLLPVSGYDRGLLGPGAVRSTVSDMRPMPRRSFEPVGHKEPILRQQNAHADVVAPVQPGSQDRGDGLAFPARLRRPQSRRP